jgi:hypothetical protein
MRRKARDNSGKNSTRQVSKFSAVRARQRHLAGHTQDVTTQKLDPVERDEHRLARRKRMRGCVPDTTQV